METLRGCSSSNFCPTKVSRPFMTRSLLVSIQSKLEIEKKIGGKVLRVKQDQDDTPEERRRGKTHSPRKGFIARFPGRGFRCSVQINEKFCPEIFNGL
jgi:hypothetical protein